MSYNFYSSCREQGFIMPPNILDWVPRTDLVWFIIDAVKAIDLRPFRIKYREDGVGHPAYNPEIMLTLLIYAYSFGETSSRNIERLCERDIAFRVITANKKPDHSVIARFRKQNEAEIGEIFLEVLRLCKEAGLLKIGIIAVDGTKFQGNAALSANRTEEKLREIVEKTLEEAKKTDKIEDDLYGNKRGDELPEELCNEKSRISRIKECLKRLEESRVAKEAELANKLEERKVKEAESGKKLRGRKPKEKLDDKKPKANITDPESRILKTRNGYVQGFNAQAVADENQIVLIAEVVNQENDVQQLHPMLDRVRENLQKVGVEEKPRVALADAGYTSEANLTQMSDSVEEMLVATQKDHKEKKAAAEAPAPRGRIPSNLSARERMTRKLRTKKGKALYKMRGQLIEPVFGQIKTGLGLDKFSRRGLNAVNSEWKLICSVHNLMKMYRKGVKITKG